jgi:hypothetical protein
MAVAGTASIFRIDATTETESDAQTAGETIEFNIGGTPDGLSFLETVSAHWIEDVSQHKNPKKALDKLQDGLLATKEVILTGWFENPDTAAGPALLSNWMKEAKTNASLPVGRHGLRLDDFSAVIDQVPTTATGYLLHDVIMEIPPDHPYECNFIIKLWLDGIHP